MGGSTPLYLNYWHGSVALWQDETTIASSPPPVGTGVLLNNENWRVVDVWLSYDKHGQLDVGWHVFLEPAEGKDDRPKRLWPSYYEG